MQTKKILLFTLLIIISNILTAKEYKTKKVIIIVVDGPRYSETFGDKDRKYIPYQSKKLSKEGVILTEFYNDGFTYTNSGHTAITTGNYQEIENTGKELPNNPSFMQYFISKKNVSKDKVLLITSKKKLDILANTKDNDWKDKYQFSYICGKDEPEKLKSEMEIYGQDIKTFTRFKEILEKDTPILSMICLREPDYFAHGNQWKLYTHAIKISDSLVNEIWKVVNNNPNYKNQTTIFVTNDHGRHLDGHKDGFVSHGDDCNGCRHIYCLAIGPDFKKKFEISKHYGQIDISATISELLNFEFKSGKGKVIEEMFK